MGVTEAPAGHAVGLAEAIDHKHIVVPARRRGERTIVAEGAVDLVTDQYDVAAAAELRECLHFGVRGHDSGRIGRRIDNHAFGPPGHGRLDPRRIDTKIWIRVN